MYYERSYDTDGKIKELVINSPVMDSLPGSVIKLIYNSFEKPESQYYIFGKDTTEKHNWYYSNDSTLNKYVWVKKSFDQEIVETSYLNDIEKTDRIEIIKKKEDEIEKRIIFYSYNIEGDLRQCIEVDYTTGLRKYYSYVYVELLE